MAQAGGILRCMAIVLAATWIAGASPPAQRQEQPQPPEPAGVTNDSYPGPYSDRQADACYGSKNHDQADLCAQWRAAIAAEKAADAAEWAKWISLAGAVMSLIGTIYVARGIRLANEANRLSVTEFANARNDAAKAAKDTATALGIASREADTAAEMLRLSDKSAKRQLRAYVQIQTVQVDWSVDDRPAFAIVCKNTGQTPVRYFEIGATIRVRRGPFKIEPVPADLTYVRWSIAMGAGSERTPRCHPDNPTDGLLSIFKDRGLSLVLLGRLRYQDVFGDVWTEDIRAFVRAPRGTAKLSFAGEAQHGADDQGG